MSDRVYIFKMKLRLDDTYYIYKIGKSSDGTKSNKYSRKTIDRLLEVQRSFFMKHRYTFYGSILRDRECDNAFEIETKLHHIFKEQKHYFADNKSFDGATEFFNIKYEDELLKEYDSLIPLKTKISK